MLIDDFYYNFDGKVPRPDAVIKVHNVADYVYETELLSSLPGAEDAVSLRRPFSNTWFEFSMRAGSKTVPIAILSFENFLEAGQVFVSEDLYIYGRTGGFDIFGSIVTTYDYEGKYVSDHRNQCQVADNPNTHITEEEAKLRQKWMEQWDGVLILALSFLHCKNVELVKNPLRAIEVRERRKQNKDYFEEFYTLKIDPMKRILDTDGQAGTKGLKYALHICRGHFKTYDGKGLFGKYPGTYFWPAHMRGDGKVGKIYKDYTVEPNKS